jgi:hypothetical protein
MSQPAAAAFEFDPEATYVIYNVVGDKKVFLFPFNMEPQWYALKARIDEPYSVRHSYYISPVA